MPSRRLMLMNGNKRIALIAHDNRKRDLLDWVRGNRGVLMHHELFATGTTGSILSSELGLHITRFVSGPFGGVQQLGAAIVEGRIDFVIFFSDPLQPHPHDVDVNALLRIAVIYNIPVACNRATADFMVSSPLMREEYRRLTMGIEDQLVRWIPSSAEATATEKEAIVPSRATRCTEQTALSPSCTSGTARR
jgi:methylglyoxal synthase